MSMGTVLAVCFSAERGVAKRNQRKGYLRENLGLPGDAHAGPGKSQVSILLEQHLAPVVKKLGRKPAPGSFAENLLVSGLPEDGLVKGVLLRAGQAIIEITAIGKDAAENHTYSYEGFSLLAERGLFGRVIKSGEVKANDLVTIERKELISEHNSREDS